MVALPGGSIDAGTPELTDSGGTVALIILASFRETCDTATCNSVSPSDFIISGSVVGVAAPEPSTLALLVLGAFVLFARGGHAYMRFSGAKPDRMRF